MATQDETLLQHARAAYAHAYAPYSRFRVGAAVEGESGAIYRGVNVENASYGLTVCAERVALFAAVANGERSVRRLALATEQAPRRPEHGMPCGACRQVMAELMPLDAEVDVGGVGTFRLSELLPRPFALT